MSTLVEELEQAAEDATFLSEQFKDWRKFAIRAARLRARAELIRYDEPSSTPQSEWAKGYKACWLYLTGAMGPNTIPATSPETASPGETTTKGAAK